MKAIRYLRFSSDGQSQHSIERQDMITTSWIKFNGVELVDTFTDEGVSARTFDRPDVQALFAFIKKNHRNIDYMLVSELTRFSREAGDAINMIKEIQRKYAVRIVSASRSVIYDCSDSNSFFMMGLEFLLGNSENIKRQNDINGGIYTAKTEKGKYIGPRAPYGYKKQDGKLVPHEEQSPIVRFIFDAWLHRTPQYLVEQQAKAKGFPHRGSDPLRKLLKNPVYMGYQQVKPWKNMPGGLFPLQDFTPLISVEEWNHAQTLFLREGINRTELHADFPLRSVVKCHCGKPLTGAPSRSRNGRYYNYYKCVHGGHVNVSTTIMHEQLTEIFRYMNLTDRLVRRIEEQSSTLLKESITQQQRELMQKRTQYSKLQEKIENLEEKWINNQMQFETYNRWFDSFNKERIALNASIERLQGDTRRADVLLKTNISSLQSLDVLYEKAGITQKQEMVRRVFDSSLYYQNRTYRTAYVMPVFAHNLLILKQNQLLEVDEFKGTGLSGGAEQPLIEPLLDFVAFLSSIKVA
jgi:site-specific DNA recombinase